jgi:hypothetical protein
MLTFIYRESESHTSGQGRAQIRSIDNRRMYRLGGHRDGPGNASSSSAEKERRVDEDDEYDERGKWRRSLRTTDAISTGQSSEIARVAPVHLQVYR